MAKYEILPTTTLSQEHTVLHMTKMPELVHLSDPAFLVMTDFSQHKPHIIAPTEPMDDALNDMKVHGAHLLLVKSEEGLIEGAVTSEDILGEKPIQIIQERRINRAQITVKMIMTPLQNIAAVEIKSLQHAKIGNIVLTLKEMNQHYMLVFETNEDETVLRGMFTTSQISRQLHKDVADSLSKAQSISELQKRHIID